MGFRPAIRPVRAARGNSSHRRRRAHHARQPGARQPDAARRHGARCRQARCESAVPVDHQRERRARHAYATAPVAHAQHQSRRAAAGQHRSAPGPQQYGDLAAQGQRPLARCSRCLGASRRQARSRQLRRVRHVDRAGAGQPEQSVDARTEARWSGQPCRPAGTPACSRRLVVATRPRRRPSSRRAARQRPRRDRQDRHRRRKHRRPHHPGRHRRACACGQQRASCAAECRQTRQTCCKRKSP